MIQNCTVETNPLYSSLYITFPTSHTGRTSNAPPQPSLKNCPSSHCLYSRIFLSASNCCSSVICAPSFLPRRSTSALVSTTSADRTEHTTCVELAGGLPSPYRTYSYTPPQSLWCYPSSPSAAAYSRQCADTSGSRCLRRSERFSPMRLRS